MNDLACLPGPTGAPAPRQFHTIDDIARLLRDDFAANAIGAVVEVSEWNPQWHQGEPRVVLGLGDFTYVPPAGTDQPGAGIPIPDGSGDVGRAILDKLSHITVWVHNQGQDDGNGAAEGARRATEDLLDNTVRALREALTAIFREPPKGTWPSPDKMPEGYPAFIFGSFVSFSFVLAKPIIGGRLHVGTIASLTATDSVITDTGAEAVAEGGETGTP